MDGSRYSGGDYEKGKSGAILSSQDEVDRGRGEGSPTQGPPTVEHDDDGSIRDPLREANRIHCKQTRERRKQREQLLREVPVFQVIFYCCLLFRGLYFHFISMFPSKFTLRNGKYFGYLFHIYI